MRKLWPWLTIAAVVITLDQATKAWALQAFSLGDRVAVTPFFNLVLAFNTGAAFSFLRDAGGWQRFFFMGVALIASAVIVYLLSKRTHDTTVAVGLSLILGGALGNVWDRIQLGYVVDFIEMYYRTHFFPAFNIADSAITCGAALLIWDSFRPSRTRETA